MIKGISLSLFIIFRSAYIIVVSSWAGAGFFLIRFFKGKNAYPLSQFYKTLFERLGGTFIKVGQALSVRHDYFSRENTEAFSNLLDDVKPFNAERGIRIIESEIGGKVENIFLEFNRRPIAAASLSQVYQAKTKAGKSIVVKVKRPLIDLVVRADSFFIRAMAFIMNFSGLFSRLGIMALAEEVAEMLSHELDYRREARSIQLCLALSREISEFKVPEVFHDLCSSRVLTMEFLKGVPLRKFLNEAEKRNAGIPYDRQLMEKFDLEKICNQIYNIMLRGIFEFGYFHGDPHPGNILILDKGKIGFIDFGVMGSLSPDLRETKLNYLTELCLENTEKAATIYHSILIPLEGANHEGIVAEMNLLLKYYLARLNSPAATPAEKSSAQLFVESIQVARKFRFKLPSNVLLYYKALFTIDQVLIVVGRRFSAQKETVRYVRDYYFRYGMSLFSYKDSFARSLKFIQTIKTFPDAMKGLTDYLKSANSKSTNTSRSIISLVRKIGINIGRFLIIGALALVSTKILSPDSMSSFFTWTNTLLISGGLAFSGIHLRRI